MKDRPIVNRDPRELELHPLVALLPMFPSASGEVRDLRARIDLYGPGAHPLKITSCDKLFDGRHTRATFIEKGLTSVPCEVYEESEVSDLVWALGAGRMHLSKGAKAYWWWPYFAAKANGHGGDRKSSGKTGILNIDEIAQAIGVSPRSVVYAKVAHERFSERPDWKEKFEYKVLTGELPLYQVKRRAMGSGGTASTGQLSS